VRIRLHNATREFHVPDPNATFRRRVFGARRTLQALTGVSLTINPGERVALIGNNGSGKSTLVKLMCGIITPSAGTVEIAGFNMAERPKQVFARIGVMFGQKSLLFPDLTVRDALGLYRVVYGIAPTRYQQTIEELDTYLAFSDLLDRPVRKLSLGQRVRCELVAALLHRPEVLFLDEPTIGLDAGAVQGLKRVLLEWFPPDTTIVLVCHDSSVAAGLCTRIIELSQGSLTRDLAAQPLWDLGPFSRLAIHYQGSPPSLRDVWVAEERPERVVVDVPINEENRVRRQVGTSTLVTRIETSATPIAALLEILQAKNEEQRAARV
jgi:ABC-2 type transport system ATP-binding protein